ncbi:hypothetical protein PV779_65230, partial [Streptomyces sp. ID01-9D]|nr:hypothetical protein [Streptomyces sp. ID01-9D]
MSPTSPANPHCPTRRLTTAQALVAFLARQYTERDGRRQRLISATWGIFGHGNVAGIGQALVEAAAVALGVLPGQEGHQCLSGGQPPGGT